MKLSIIVPVFNEFATIGRIIDRIASVNLLDFDREIIIVDDFSTDGTRDFLEKIAGKYIVIFHDKNVGKGGAIKTALTRASGEAIIIQDADLEYDPADIQKLIGAMKKTNADAVYGSRNLGKSKRGYWLFYLGGRFLTFFLNLIMGSSLTDINTGYKLFKTNVLKNLNIESDGFEFCEEVTVKLVKKKYRIVEVPINYSPRTFEEGKKIFATDGIKGILAIMKYVIKKS